MSDDYFRVVLNRSKKFSRLCNCNLNGVKHTFPVVIDTGCSFSYITYNLLGFDKENRIGYKMQALNEWEQGLRDITLSVGIESYGMKVPDISTLSYDELLHRNDVCFIYTISNFCIGCYEIGDIDVKVSFDRGSLALLGMNVLSKMDIHIRDNRLIGTKISDMGLNYYKEMRESFDFEPCGRQYARFVREEIK